VVWLCQSLHQGENGLEKVCAYDAMLVIHNHALYSAGVKIPQGQQDFDVVHGE
jgi:hypothetical protein